jgi:hypothetical protein
VSNHAVVAFPLGAELAAFALTIGGNVGIEGCGDAFAKVCDVGDSCASVKPLPDAIAVAAL